MGRIADLFGEVAAAADEGAGLTLPPEDWDRLRGEWSDEDIDDALALVRESLLQGDLVEAADSLNARLIEVFGTLGEADAFALCEAGGGVLDLDALGGLARRIDRLEEILALFRDNPPPQRQGFDQFLKRLMNRGIEHEMQGSDDDEGE